MAQLKNLHTAENQEQVLNRSDLNKSVSGWQQIYIIVMLAIFTAVVNLSTASGSLHWKPSLLFQGNWRKLNLTVSRVVQFFFLLSDIVYCAYRSYNRIIKSNFGRGEPLVGKGANFLHFTFFEEVSSTLSRGTRSTKKARQKPFGSQYLRASLCKILISSFAHKMDFAHNFSVDFF